MPSSHILAYPSVSSSLNNLQYQTNISNVPLHAGPHGRAAESEEMLKRGLSQTTGGPGRTSALAGMSSPAIEQRHVDDALPKIITPDVAAVTLRRLVFVTGF
ncbi:unnamed protein product [Rhizoctonia solani]|uniref:Uncharacterized protein n=1 Tax=Rhizoctonia solani TaxID=456999 RepID=A0A8H3HNW8_9AGAM|nr:unnamed protein product [Rhizoctonia solani]CAE7231221.1 unnamed protein product [Rhizoctonia solani]